MRHGDDAATEPLDSRDLCRGCALGNDHGAGDAEPSRVPRDALRHVPRARRPHTVSELRARREGHPVAGAADLERSDRLQALELEPDLGRRVRAQAHERRADRGTGDALAGRLDLRQRDHLCLTHFTRSRS
jgi:hypothetical protein